MQRKQNKSEKISGVSNGEVIFLGMENEISNPFEPPPTDGQDAVYDDVAWDSSPIVCLAILISIIVFFFAVMAALVFLVEASPF